MKAWTQVFFLGQQKVIHLSSVKPREDMKNIITKNFNLKDEIGRGWQSRRNTPRIIMSDVDTKGLNKKFTYETEDASSKM